MKPYYTLTERGQARRLRALAFNALQQYDLDVSHLSLVTNGINGIFRLDLQDGQKFILRISLPERSHTLDYLLAEMDWLKALAKDTTLSVSRPVPARDGSLVVEASANGVPEARLSVIFTWVPGTDLVRHLSPLNISRLGELMAHLHMHSKTYQPPSGYSLLHYDRVFPFSDPVILFDDPYQHLFSPESRKLYQQVRDGAQEAVDRLKTSGEPMRILHGDLHQWNVRYYRGVLAPIDFEDLMWGWPVQDIATSLYYFLDYPDYPTFRAAFQAGYSRCSPWPERCSGEIDAFIAARALVIVNFVLNQTSPKWTSRAAEFVSRSERRLRRLMSDQSSV